MLQEARERTLKLQSRMQAEGIELAVFTDESSIAYLSGFWGIWVSSLVAPPC